MSMPAYIHMGIAVDARNSVVNKSREGERGATTVKQKSVKVGAYRFIR